MFVYDLEQALGAYRDRWPMEAKTVTRFVDFLHSGSQLFDRSHLEGHFTGSAWVVSRDGRRTLLTLHRKLGRWLQLGGHADGEHDLRKVALREAGEESGLAGLRVEGDVLDIDRHRIPARGAEPEHWHYDVRYVVRAGADEAFVVSPESVTLAWRPIAEVAADAALGESLRRLARKWLARPRQPGQR